MCKCLLCMVGCVLFRLWQLCSSFRLDRSCISVCGGSITESGSCCLVSLFIFRCMSNFSRLKKVSFLYYHPNLVSESLAYGLKSTSFFPNLSFFSPIPTFRRVASRIAVSRKSSRVYFLCWCLWFVYLLKWSIVYLTKEQATFAECRKEPLCWLSEEHLPIMTPRHVMQVQRALCFDWHFYLGENRVAIPDPEFF